MRTLISFLTALVVVISAHAQDSDNRTMLNVAQAKIGNSKATTVKQVASDAKCISAFVNHFNYNDTTHYIIRSRYTEPEWMEMVYTELSNNHPIFYSARDINIELGIFG